MTNNLTNETLEHLNNEHVTEKVEAFIDWRNPVPDCIGYRVEYSHGIVLEIRVEQYTGLHFAYVYPSEDEFFDYALAGTEIHLLTEDRIRKIHDNIVDFINMCECRLDDLDYYCDDDDDSDC